MTDKTSSGASGSDRLGGFLSRLHPVTQLLVIAVLVHLAASLVTAVVSLAAPTITAQLRPFSVRLAEQLRAVAYSVLLFGSAASVEFLFRIWTELKLARRAD